MHSFDVLADAESNNCFECGFRVAKIVKCFKRLLLVSLTTLAQHNIAVVLGKVSKA